jgi:hypothetical protein
LLGDAVTVRAVDVATLARTWSSTDAVGSTSKRAFSSNRTMVAVDVTLFRIVHLVP